MPVSSLEKIKKAASRKQPESIPVAPYMGNYGARLSGLPLSVYCRDGLKMAEAQYGAWRVLGQDVVVAQSDNYYIAEGFGVILDFPDDALPVVRKPAITSLDEVCKLKVPNPLTEGRMPVYLEAIGALAKELGDSVAIRSPGTGPFSLASHLLGLENFLVELALAHREPDGTRAGHLRKLLEITTETLINFARAALDAGAHIVQAGDSLASIDVISPQMYETWAYPYEKVFFEEIGKHAAKYEGMTLLHICGDTTKALPLMAQTGADILELDYKVDLGTARNLVGDSVCLMGNLDPSAVLLQGTPGIVYEEAVKCIENAGLPGGFILGSGCEVAVDTPLENMQAMVRAAREWRPGKR